MQNKEKRSFKISLVPVESVGQVSCVELLELVVVCQSIAKYFANRRYKRTKFPNTFVRWWGRIFPGHLSLLPIVIQLRASNDESRLLEFKSAYETFLRSRIAQNEQQLTTMAWTTIMMALEKYVCLWPLPFEVEFLSHHSEYSCWFHPAPTNHFLPCDGCCYASFSFSRGTLDFLALRLNCAPFLFPSRHNNPSGLFTRLIGVPFWTAIFLRLQLYWT